MARGESSNRNEGGADDGTSRARGAEGLATTLPQALDQLALLAAIRGDATRQQAFIRSAEFARAHGVESESHLARLLAAGPPVPDRRVEELLRHLSDSPAGVLLRSELADLPADLRSLLESGAVTLEQLAALHAHLGMTSLSELAAAIADHAIRTLPMFDPAAEHAIAAVLPGLRHAVPRLTLGRAATISQPILEGLRAAAGVAWAASAGSLRRGQETVGDIELVAATTRPEDVTASLLAIDGSFRPFYKSGRRVYFRMDRVQIGVQLPEPVNAGAVLLSATGSIGHLTQLRAHADTLGWRLTRDGLRRPDGAHHLAATEEDVYAALKLPFIPPEIREGTDEVHAAAAGALPVLVTEEDIRGDLHMHTEFSDGRDTVDAMVVGCRRLGYQYMAITDHSPGSAASRNLSVDSIARQADEIAALRERYPDITILHGCEVDILPDGRLDFTDRILERLDIVLASLHERAGSSREDLLRRYTSAMKHPLVALITHPTNRFVASREGYDLDYDALFETAVETGTIVEIDGAPGHLDLDGALARRAIAAGATVSIDSDSHRAAHLAAQMQLGLTTARRGWVEPRHVVNTRPLDELLAIIRAKRQS